MVIRRKSPSFYAQIWFIDWISFSDIYACYLCRVQFPFFYFLVQSVYYMQYRRVYIYRGKHGYYFCGNCSATFAHSRDWSPVTRLKEDTRSSQFSTRGSKMCMTEHLSWMSTEVTGHAHLMCCHYHFGLYLKYWCQICVRLTAVIVILYNVICAYVVFICIMFRMIAEVTIYQRCSDSP